MTMRSLNRFNHWRSHYYFQNPSLLLFEFIIINKLYTSYNQKLSQKITKNYKSPFKLQTKIMQIESHLFRIAQRTLKNPNAKCCVSILFSIASFFCLYYCLVFVLGILYVLPTNDHLSECFRMSTASTQSQFKIETDSVYMIFMKEMDSLKVLQARMNNLTVTQNEYCTIFRNINTQNFIQKPFQFTWTQNVLYFNPEQRQIYKFNNYTIVLSSVPRVRYFFYSMNTLLTNELIVNPKGLFPTSNPYVRSSTIAVNTFLPSSLELTQKVYKVIKALVYYIVTSIVTSMYIYGTIVAAPAVIIIFLRCTNFVNNGGNMTDVYKVFPWIGMHSLIRQTSDSPVIKGSSKEICWCIIFYFFFLYFVYYAVILQLSQDIFYQKTQQGLEEMLFGFIALIEFSSIVFIRTRPFLKYFPATHTLLMLMFLFYCQFVTFGLKVICFKIVSSASLALFTFMILSLEIPAQNGWNRARYYTPTPEKPRIGFLPLFNLGWINSLPDQWTMMFPLFGRNSFTQRQLAFADRNFALLDQVLGVNQQNQNPANNP